MTVGSLFSGIGGLELGLERAGFEVRWQVENEPFCCKVLEERWPGVKRYGDIKDLTGSELEPVDLICGGYPCQPFSQAGKRGGETDARHLWPEMLRLIRVLRPRYVLVENVPGHLSLGFGTVLGDLAGCGYDAEWRCLRASDFGASHIRKRVFIVAYLEHALDRGSQVGRAGSTGQVRARGSLDLRYAAEEPSADLAHRPPGGRGELRQPSGSGGQPDGSNEAMADADRGQCEQRGGTEPAEVELPGLDGGGGTLENPSRDGQRGLPGEEGRGGRRGVCATGEPMERVGKYVCGSCLGTFDAFEYVNRIRSEATGERMLAFRECPWCDDSIGAAYITYDTEHGGTGDPDEPDRPPEDEDLADSGDGLIQEPGRGPQGRAGLGPAGADVPDASQPGLSDTESETGIGAGDGDQGRTASELRGAPQLADATSLLTQQHEGIGPRPAEEAGRRSFGQPSGRSNDIPAFAPGPSDPRWPDILRERPDLAPAGISYPAAPTIARSLAKDRAKCFPKRGRKRRRKQLAIEIALALTEGVAWEEAAVESLRRMVDGFPGGAHGIVPYIEAREWLGGLNADQLRAKEAAMKDRTKRLKSLGNAVVPACAEWIGRKIIEADRNTREEGDRGGETEGLRPL